MYSVLLVDDEELILAGMEKLISWDDFGLEIVHTASDGVEAWAYLSTHPVDILITDIRMPGLDGIGLLERLREADRKTKAIVVSGYDDFVYVQRALRLGIENYLLKPINEEELSATLLTIIDKLDRETRDLQIRKVGVNTLADNVISRWVRGNIAWEELESRAELLGIDLGASWYQTAVLIADEGVPPRESWREALARGFAGRANLYTAIGPDKEMVVLFVGKAPIDAEALRTGMLDAIEAEGGAKPGWSLVIIGDAVEDAQRVALSYRAISKLQTLQRIAPGMVAPKAETEAPEPWLSEACEALTGLLDRGTVSRLHEALVPVFDRLSQVEKTSPERAAAAMMEIISCLFQTDDPAYWTEHAPALEEARTLSVGVLWPRILDAAEGYIRSREQAHLAHPVVQKIMAYVDANYGEDISLKTLSAQMHFSAAYLGQVFKRETGRLFLDYLCEYRIEKAKQLLAESTQKSYDIATMVGFRNPNYFANVFRKMTGVYPTIYRKQHAAKAE